MKNKRVKTIIFDIDGTLSDNISWLELTEGLGASPKTLLHLLTKLRSGKLRYNEAKNKVVTLWKNTGNANRPYMKKMFNSWKLKKDAYSTIDYLKKSYRICLISGSVDLYVKSVADKLGIIDWYANTELIWDNNDNLIDINYFPNQSQKKLEQFRSFITKYSLDINKCAVVGDGDSDIELFKELPYGFAINKNPYPELEALAIKNISNLSQLKEIF